MYSPTSGEDAYTNGWYVGSDVGRQHWWRTRSLGFCPWLTCVGKDCSTLENGETRILEIEGLVGLRPSIAWGSLRYNAGRKGRCSSNK